MYLHNIYFSNYVVKKIVTIIIIIIIIIVVVVFVVIVVVSAVIVIAVVIIIIIIETFIPKRSRETKTALILRIAYVNISCNGSTTVTRDPKYL